MKEETVSQKLRDIFETFSFSWPYFLFTLTFFLLAVTILVLLAYRPAKKMLKRRQNYIQQNIDDAVKAKEDALKIKNEANESLLDTYKRIDKMINDAKIDSEKIIDDKTEEAKNKAHSIIEQANNSITKSWRDFESQQKKIIVENAIEISQKILGREIKDEENKKMIQQLLEEANNEL
ncbi:F0F1 ATP synthase subunit B family protein [Mycoplasma sp. 128]